MKVMSLFDGISCGRVALERAKIQVDKYYSSEIDKYAIQVAQKNYPDTIQLGDIEKINFHEYTGKIDLLIGGSPCQGFSFAGKQLNFLDPRSRLFFKFAEALEIIKPKYFLFENVKMKKESQDVITKYMGVEPIEINSALVSAQNRVRLYWTNIPNVTQPHDKGILLENILEYGIVDRQKSFCIDANYYKGGNLKSYFEKNRRQLVFPETFTPYTVKKLEEFIINNGYIPEMFNPYNCREIKDKSPCLTAQGNSVTNSSTVLIKSQNYRKLTPIECERLQTLPDNYTEGISNTQRYKSLGNGWTVDVIAWIFSHINIESISKGA